jgi:hypothetical protein
MLYIFQPVQYVRQQYHGEHSVLLGSLYLLVIDLVAQQNNIDVKTPWKYEYPCFFFLNAYVVFTQILIWTVHFRIIKQFVSEVSYGTHTMSSKKRMLKCVGCDIKKRICSFFVDQYCFVNKQKVIIRIIIYIISMLFMLR